ECARDDLEVFGDLDRQILAEDHSPQPLDLFFERGHVLPLGLLLVGEHRLTQQPDRIGLTAQASQPRAQGLQCLLCGFELVVDALPRTVVDERSQPVDLLAVGFLLLLLALEKPAGVLQPHLQGLRIRGLIPRAGRGDGFFAFLCLSLRLGHALVERPAASRASSRSVRERSRASRAVSTASCAASTAAAVDSTAVSSSSIPAGSFPGSLDSADSPARCSARDSAVSSPARSSLPMS